MIIKLFLNTSMQRIKERKHIFYLVCLILVILYVHKSFPLHCLGLMCYNKTEIKL